jgi:hypothetical protein
MRIPAPVAQQLSFQVRGAYDFRAYEFWIPGMRFQLFVGQTIPPVIRMTCGQRSLSEIRK